MDYVVRYTAMSDRILPGQGHRGPVRRARQQAGPQVLPVRPRAGRQEKAGPAKPGGGLRDLRAPPGNRLEKLKGEREGQCSIRINDQWRMCFRWTESGAEDVEIVDNR